MLSRANVINNYVSDKIFEAVFSTAHKADRVVAERSRILVWNELRDATIFKNAAIIKDVNDTNKHSNR